jgi:hypothetical protein
MVRAIEIKAVIISTISVHHTVRNGTFLKLSHDQNFLDNR